MIKRDGEKIPALLSGSIVRDENNKIKGKVILARDITDIKNNQYALEEALLKAEQASKAKSEFLGNMSHEIRTPMNGVIGMTDVLLFSKLDESQRQNAEIIKSSANSLMTIIDDILEFSKIEAGKLLIEDRPFNLNKHLEELFLLLIPGSRKKGLQLEYILEGNLPEIMIGDIGRLRQVIINIIGNAVKFTQDGSVKLLVKKQEENNDEIILHFTCVDTGIGIPEEKLDIIFRSFEQADISTTKIYGGTGLGLAISKELVSLMGGNIDVKSTEGVGTEFYFTICLQKVDNNISIKQDDIAAINDDEIKKKYAEMAPVLVVEDNIINQMVATNILKQLGLKYDTADDGRKAIDLLEKNEYSLVLMDMRMPILNGVDTTKEVRNPFSKVLDHNIKIIAMTANAAENDKEECLNAGMNDFMTKPITPEGLRNKIG